jgi:hypothetical protein
MTKKIKTKKVAKEKKIKLKKGLVKCSRCPLVLPISLAHKTITETLCGKCVLCCEETKET